MKLSVTYGIISLRNEKKRPGDNVGDSSECSVRGLSSSSKKGYKVPPQNWCQRKDVEQNRLGKAL